jgi:hypothetical protein
MTSAMIQAEIRSGQEGKTVQQMVKIGLLLAYTLNIPIPLRSFEYQVAAVKQVNTLIKFSLDSHSFEGYRVNDLLDSRWNSDIKSLKLKEGIRQLDLSKPLGNFTV